MEGNIGSGKTTLLNYFRKNPMVEVRGIHFNFSFKKVSYEQERTLKNSLRSLRIQVLICISACLFCFLVFLHLRTDYQGRTKKKEVKYKQIEADTLSPSFIPTFFFLDLFLQVIVNWALHCPRYLSDRFVHSLKIMLPSS